MVWIRQQKNARTVKMGCWNRWKMSSEDENGGLVKWIS